MFRDFSPVPDVTTLQHLEDISFMHTFLDNIDCRIGSVLCQFLSKIFTEFNLILHIRALDLVGNNFT